MMRALDARQSRWSVSDPAKQKLVYKRCTGECGTAVITTLGSNYIIRTHKHRLRNKRELPFRRNHW